MLSIIGRTGMRTSDLLARPGGRMMGAAAVVIGGRGGTRRVFSVSCLSRPVAVQPARVGLMGGSRRGLSSQPEKDVSESVDCPSLKKLYEERAKNGGSPYRWDNDALETWVGDWQDRQERPLTWEKSLPGFGYHCEADFEVERHQRHNKMFAMTSEILLAYDCKDPIAWYDRLSVEEKYDAYHHMYCPDEIELLPPPQEPQWVADYPQWAKDWSPHDGGYAEYYRDITCGFQHWRCFKNQYNAIHIVPLSHRTPESWDEANLRRQNRFAAYGRFFPGWVERMNVDPQVSEPQDRSNMECEKDGFDTSWGERPSWVFEGGIERWNEMGYLEHIWVEVELEERSKEDWRLSEKMDWKWDREEKRKQKKAEGTGRGPAS